MTTTRPDIRPDIAVQGGALSDRGFWAIFTGAWVAYLGLFVTAATTSRMMSLGASLGMALVEALPPAAVSIPVALNRRSLLRPERTLGRTVLVHVLVGLLYALVTGVLSVAALKLAPVQWSSSDKGGAVEPFLMRVVGGLVLYMILAGFLMWTESLRRVHESRSLAAREAMLRAQAEAKALRAQFNPHFVFNTLHSLMLLVRADPSAAERAIEDVATLIRYASVLQRQDVDLVPLAKELEVARRYLALEKLRLEDRLRVEWSVDAEPASVAVPPFALQTLLENAIKHGLEPKPEGGTVGIRALVEDGALTIAVSDDGEGSDPQKVAGAVNHGLEILGRRLASLYGEDASLSWSTAPGAGFTATLRIPAQTPPPIPAHGGTPPPAPGAASVGARP
jgi:two-component sensor histidine kinase